jgi:hypothetical protein
MMVSAAIPPLFMPVRLGREQMVRRRCSSPLSVRHQSGNLGADRVLVIGLSDNLYDTVNLDEVSENDQVRCRQRWRGGHLLNSTFVDTERIWSL